MADYLNPVCQNPHPYGKLPQHPIQFWFQLLHCYHQLSDLLLLIFLLWKPQYPLQKEKQKLLPLIAHLRGSCCSVPHGKIHQLIHVNAVPFQHMCTGFLANIPFIHILITADHSRNRPQLFFLRAMNLRIFITQIYPYQKSVHHPSPFPAH